MVAESGVATMAASSSILTTTPSASSSTASTAVVSHDVPASSPRTTAEQTPPKAGPKPIKLRAACNHCFTAKVRCDGNKEGCRRCSEKRLSCVYSESRVGKVVGKRRKRPIDDSIGTINSQAWIVNGSVPIQSIPSPANTHGSDESNKRHCHVPNWSSFLVGGESGFLTFDETAESLSALDMADNRSFSVASELAFFSNTGLPTPALSPPPFTRYLSPAQLETRPVSRHASCPVDPSKLHPQPFATPLPRLSDPTLEDEETVCVKLLAHLKKHSVDESQPREVQLELLKKCNAAVRRILRSKTIRAEYPCHLILSAIINHLVRLCERLCQSKFDDPRHMDSQFLQDQVHFDPMSGLFDTSALQQLPLPDQDVMVSLVSEVMAFTSVVGDMLKKRPLQGFQHLGRHETFHVELEQRLKKATGLLQT